MQTKVVRKSKSTGFWSNIVHRVIRPSRSKYSKSEIKRSCFLRNRDDIVHREEVVEFMGKIIIVHVFDQVDKDNRIILYAHGNSSCCLEGMRYLKDLPQGFSLATFDFIGCGNNQEEDTITLGRRESAQLAAVSEFLRTKNYRVFLWGRSMGASSVLLYGKADIIVADSPFTSAKKLFRQMITTQNDSCLPNCLVSFLFPFVFYKLRGDIKSQTQCDLEQLNIEQAVKQCNPQTTIIFLSGHQDHLIDKQHSLELYRIFAGSSKYLEIVPGGHNDARPQSVINRIMGLIEKHSSSHRVPSHQILTNKAKTDNPMPHQRKQSLVIEQLTIQSKNTNKQSQLNKCETNRNTRSSGN